MEPRLISTAWGTFQCYPDDSVGNALVAGEFWDAHLRPYFDEGAHADSGWAIDVGAYIGFHSCYLARKFHTVVAVEPVWETFNLLRLNLLTNNPRCNVIPLCLAAYHHEGVLRQGGMSEIGYDPTLSTHAPAVPWFPTLLGGSEPHIVAGNLDARLPDTAPVQLIKIDAQGCDLRVLWGLSDTIARCRPLILLEWEANYAKFHGDTWEDVLLWAQRYRYTVTRISDHFCDYVLRAEEKG